MKSFLIVFCLSLAIYGFAIYFGLQIAKQDVKMCIEQFGVENITFCIK